MCEEFQGCGRAPESGSAGVVAYDGNHTSDRVQRTQLGGGCDAAEYMKSWGVEDGVEVGEGERDRCQCLLG